MIQIQKINLSEFKNDRNKVTERKKIGNDFSIINY